MTRRERRAGPAETEASPNLPHRLQAGASDRVRELTRRGLLAHRQGRHKEAIADLERALALAPGTAAIHAGLAEAYRASADPASAERHYRQVAELQPDAVSLVNLGNARMALARHKEAAASYTAALRRDSRLPEAYYGLGTALSALGIPEAGDAFGRAAALRPGFAPAHEGLVDACIDAGAWGAALQACSAALLRTDSPRLRVQYVDAVVNVDLAAEVPGLREAMHRALDERWTRPQALARAACDIVMLRKPLDADDRLVSILLDLAPICHPEIERALTKRRRAVLETVASGGDLSPGALASACRLARQCFINEYAWACTPAESAHVERLRGRVQAELDTGTLPAPARVVAVALYLPLSVLPGPERLLALAESDDLTALLAQQISEQAQEQHLAGTIARFNTIEDDVSRRVREQYETNPYPRWITTGRPAAAVPLGEWLAGRFPGAPLAPLATDRGLDVLIAGCGTGQQALETARSFAESSILAIDLSLTSLAYAARMTAKLGVERIQYAQADLLGLATLGRRFDMIGAGGVLHHMADPWEGWRALLACLRPGGVMNVLLYTERGRADVRTARDWIAAQGYPATPDGIRACRQALMALPDAWAQRLCESPDFNSTSGCRDLLFHVQEAAVTLTELDTFLRAERLALIGVDALPGTEQAFRAWNRSHDQAIQPDLRRWERFEAEYPRCFANMINIWVRSS